MPNLEKYLNKPVKELIKRKTNKFTKEEKERHQIYSNLLFAITSHYFNGFKYGTDKLYPLNPESDPQTYLGHNIAAIAVNAKGEIIDFEFNHNAIFNSSVEHAESRIIRRVFSLSQVYDTYEKKNDKLELLNTQKKYGNLLSEVTVYTSLESCTQCTGIMTLGNVKNVVYLQDDPGMYHIGNIVKNLTDGQGYIEAPLPISGKEIGFTLYNKLNRKFDKFVEQQKSKTGKPFSVDEEGSEKYTSSITSFLCTNEAKKIFEIGKSNLANFKLEYPKFKPNKISYSNNMALRECKLYFDYAINDGRRATQHRM